MVANSGQSTQQFVNKSMIGIPGYSILRMAINTSWKYKFTNTQLYRGMPKISDVIKQRRLRLAGHCIRDTDELAHN